MDYAFHVPINSLSFGNVSISLLREAYKLGHQPSIFLIGQGADLSAQNEDKDFNTWLQSNINKAYKVHKKTNPCIKLWHLNGSMESVSYKQVTYSFYELDSPTQEEINIVKNNHKVLFPCDYNTNIFKEYGCENVETVPLAFDSHNFKRTEKTYFTDGRISFMLGGKWEAVRKRTDKTIQAWVKKFGNNPKYFLNCAIWNPFINPEQQKQIYINILQGKHVGNVQFLNFMAQNSLYNDFICSNEIVIGMGTESWGLPEFQALNLGLHGVISNYAGHKQWVNNEVACLVNPSGKTLAYDGMFFHPNQPFNQGNVYDFDEQDFINQCEEAIKRVQTNKVNQKGLELQEKFKYSETFNRIYKELENANQ